MTQKHYYGLQDLLPGEKNNDVQNIWRSSKKKDQSVQGGGGLMQDIEN